MQQVRIDFDNPGLPQSLGVVEGESQSRIFQAALYKSGAAYTAPAGAVYSIMYRGFGPQNQGWYDTIEDGAGKRAACTVSGNVVTCELARQALRVPGHLTVVLCVSDAKGYMLKSWPIMADVRNDGYEDTGEIEMYFNLSGLAGNYLTQLEKAMADAETTRNNLISTSAQVKKDIDAKAAAALESIPESYTELDGSVKQLKEDLVNSCLRLKTLPTDTFYAENPYTVYINQEAYHTNANMALPNAIDLSSDVKISGLNIHKNTDGSLRLTGTPSNGICTFKYSEAHFRSGRYYTSAPSNVTMSLRSDSYSVDFNSSFTSSEETKYLWYTIRADTYVDITIQPMLYDRDVQYETGYIECKWEKVNNKFVAYSGINHMLSENGTMLTFETPYNKCRPEFWGAIGNGDDDTIALNKMMKYCSANKESIEFPRKTYGVSSPISVLGVMDVDFNYAIIKALQDTTALVIIDCETNNRFRGVFRRCILDGERKAQSCILITKNINAMTFEDLQVNDPARYGIWCKTGGGEFYKILLRSRNDDGVVRTALKIDVADSKWKYINAVNFCTFAHVKGITHMEQIHPFITYSSYNNKSIGIYVDATSVFVTNSYIDSYFRCFFNPNDNNRGYGFIFATNVMFFWSVEYFTGDVRPSICYNGIRCRLINCRIHRPDGTTSKTLLFGEEGDGDKTYINIHVLNNVEGLAREPKHDASYDIN